MSAFFGILNSVVMFGNLLFYAYWSPLPQYLAWGIICGFGTIMAAIIDVEKRLPK